MLLRIVQDEVTCTAGLDDAVGDGDRVNTVAVGTLVRTTVLGARHLELHDAQLKLCIIRRPTESVVTHLLATLRDHSLSRKHRAQGRHRVGGHLCENSVQGRLHLLLEVMLLEVRQDLRLGASRHSNAAAVARKNRNGDCSVGATSTSEHVSKRKNSVTSSKGSPSLCLVPHLCQ